MRRDEPAGTPPTLGRLADLEHDLSPWCNGCGRHGETIPIETLVARFGRDMVNLDVAKHLRCGHCGSKRVVTHVRPRGQPFTPGYGPPGSQGRMGR